MIDFRASSLERLEYVDLFDGRTLLYVCVNVRVCGYMHVYVSFVLLCNGKQQIG